MGAGNFTSSSSKPSLLVYGLVSFALAFVVDLALAGGLVLVRVVVFMLFVVFFSSLSLNNHRQFYR